MFSTMPGVVLNCAWWFGSLLATTRQMSQGDQRTSDIHAVCAAIEVPFSTP
jgi:hypothetical protein